MTPVGVTILFQYIYSVMTLYIDRNPITTSLCGEVVTFLEIQVRIGAIEGETGAVRVNTGAMQERTGTVRGRVGTIGG